MRMLRYRKLDDGIEKRYYIIFQATGKYTRFKFVNRSYRSQVTSSIVTNYSTQSGIPGNVTVSQDSGRVRVTRNYTGTKRSDGQYDITETVTTITATKGYFYAKKIQLEPAVNTDLANVVPYSYKEGQNTIESFIKETVDSVIIKAKQIRLEGYTTINGNFSIDEKGNMTANNGTFNGTINAMSGKIGGFTISNGILLWKQSDYFSNDSRSLKLGVSSDENTGVVDVSFNAATSGRYGVKSCGSNIGGAAIFGSIYSSTSSSFVSPYGADTYAGFFNGGLYCSDDIYCTRISAKTFRAVSSYNHTGSGANSGWDGIDFDYDKDLDNYRLQVRGGIIVGIKHE